LPTHAAPDVIADRGRVVLPVVAVVALALTVSAIVWSAGPTLGYDFHAYGDAANRLLHGEPLYDPSVDVAGGFAIYLYPPPFAVAIIPLAIVGGTAAVWAWTAFLVVAFVAGVAVIPVRPWVRWLILALGAIDWPFLYSIKLGQVGPILFLLFALGWRALDRPGILGATIGLGALVKVQPALLVVWAALTGRWRAIAAAAIVVGAAGVATLLVTGLQPWIDYPTLLSRVASPLTTPHNFTPGAVAVQAGASLDVAGLIQAVTTLLAIGAVVLASRRATGEAAYLVTVVASQLVSPLLWDHYAMLLLLPVAWLLERRAWWALAIPLVTSVFVIGLLPAIVYPIAFAAALVAPLVLRRRASERAVGSQVIGAPT
jgi:alpha-1,2-mannosyltransferase